MSTDVAFLQVFHASLGGGGLVLCSMASPIVPVGPVTLEEYLAFEESSPEKHEYVGGYIYPLRGVSAMSGASRRHHVISRNVFLRLATAAQGGPCQLFHEGFKLVASDNLVYYPDIMALCDASDADPRFARNPCLIAEITSPDSGRVDRGEKLEAYRRIASLREYLIMEQAHRRVARHWRDSTGEWQQQELVGDGAMRIACPETTLTLDEIYEGLAPLTVKEMEAIGYAV